MESKCKFLVNFAYIGVMGLIIFLVCKFLLKILLPFIVAGIIAVIMQKPADVFSKKFKINKGGLAAVFSATVYIAVALITVFLIYKTAVFLAGFSERLPEIFGRISKIAEKMKEVIPIGYNSVFDGFLSDILKKSGSNLAGFFSKVLADIVKNTPGFLFSGVVALVASCYIAKDYNILVKFIKLLLGAKTSENLIKIKVILYQSVFKLLKGYLILAVLTFAEVCIGLMVLRVKYAVFFALIISFVDILPVLGTGSVLIPWAVISVLSGKIYFGVGLAVLYIAVLVVRNFLEPKIIGKQIGINPLFTLIAMFLGLRLFGVWGLFLFPVVLIAVIKYYKSEPEESLSV